MQEDYNSSYTGLQIDTAVGNALSIKNLAFLEYEIVTPNSNDQSNSNSN